MSVNMFQKWHKRGLFEDIRLLHNDRVACNGISDVKVKKKQQDFQNCTTLQGGWLAFSAKARKMFRFLPSTQL